jgi:N-terminal half of MaoC dehydratase
MSVDSSNTESLSHQPITNIIQALTQADIEKFKSATFNRYSQIPPALPTLFRAAEFQWLDRMKVDMRQVLHTEQVYEFLEPLTLGVPMTITTSIVSQRERSGLRLISLSTDIITQERLCVRAVSSFVLRLKAGSHVE